MVIVLLQSEKPPDAIQCEKPLAGSGLVCAVIRKYGLDDVSFYEEREQLMRLSVLSKEKLTALIDNPKITHQRRFEEMLAELDGEVL